MNNTMTSAEKFFKYLPFSHVEKKPKHVHMTECGLDELEWNIARSIVVETGMSLVFHDDCGNYYIPASEAEIREYGERHPQDLHFQLACFHRAKYGFHTN